jgi:ADP-ribosylglycohydrolase
MLGAIAGDIIGSIYEWNNIKSTEFPLFTARSKFTDDSVHTIALADAFLSGETYQVKLKEYYRSYPGAGYGGMFHVWASSDSLEL